MKLLLEFFARRQRCIIKALSGLGSQSIANLSLNGVKFAADPTTQRLSKILPDKSGTVMAHHQNQTTATTYR